MKNYMIRHKMFETNSSSNHTLCWSDGGFDQSLHFPALGDNIVLRPGQYGWYGDNCDTVIEKAEYLMAAGYRTQVIEILEEVYPNLKIDVTDTADEDGYSSYVDHQSDGNMSQSQTGYSLKEIIFNPKLYIVITNDCCDLEDGIEAHKPLASYKNGNAEVVIESDGTRKVSWPKEEKLSLEFPLNIDIRVSTKCAFGADKNGTPTVCKFCHESASKVGIDCDYEALLNQLKGLPEGIELAIGCNEMTKELASFIHKVDALGFIVNLTVNMGHLARDWRELDKLLGGGHVKALGVSYRPHMWNKTNKDLLRSYINEGRVIFHVIAGIDSVDEVAKLQESLKWTEAKLLVLGEKDFGFHKGELQDETKRLDWVTWAAKTLTDEDAFGRYTDGWKAIGFDNLAVEQLYLQDLVPKDVWSTVFQGEHSFYINAVEQTFSTSSRSSTHPFDNTPFDKTSVKDYYKLVVKAKGM